MLPASDERQIRLLPMLLGGVVASGLILVANLGARSRGWTDLDLPVVLGLTFRRTSSRGAGWAGVSWYFLTGGALVPTVYWLALRRLRRAGPAAGLLLGTAHLLAASLVLAVTEPSRPRARLGRGRPMGPFLSHYGWFERVTNLVAHLGYGLIVVTCGSRLVSRGGA